MEKRDRFLVELKKRSKELGELVAQQAMEEIHHAPDTFLALARPTINTEIQRSFNIELSKRLTEREGDNYPARKEQKSSP